MPVFAIDLENVRTTDRMIKATMYYPDDPEKRQHHFDLYRSASVTRNLPQDGWHDLGDIFVPIKNSLINLRAHMYPETRQRLEKGKIAGGILVLIKQLQDHGVEESANKAGSLGFPVVTIVLNINTLPWIVDF